MSDERKPWHDTPECHCGGPGTGDGETVNVTHLRCVGCGDYWEPTPEELAKALAADAWWYRDDREEAWAEVLRQRKVDAIAAEHNARQLSLLPEP